MKPQYSKNKSQRGFYMIFGSLVLVAFISLLGLAIDAAQLYRAQLRLQRALDAGVVGGSRLIGTTAETADSDIAIKVAKEIAFDNINREDIARYSPVIDSHWTNISRKTTVELTGSLRMPLLLLKILPHISKINTVQAASRATTTRAEICLALDVSGSMNDCSAYLESRPECHSSDNHSDYGPQSDLCCGPTDADKKAKLFYLKGAIANFLTLFEPHHDAIGIITFSTNATIKAQLTKNWGSDGADFANIVRNLTSGGYTNTEAAMNFCREMIVKKESEYISINSPPSTNEMIAANKAVILVTDGAPTTRVGFNVKNISVLNYDRAISEADLIRKGDDDITDVAVHTIGIGTLQGKGLISAGNFENQDAYQDYNNGNALKSNFLRRLANFPERVNINPPPLSNTYFPTNYFGSDIKRFSVYNNASPKPIEGLYLNTTDAANLDQLLLQIGLSFKARLVQ